MSEVVDTDSQALHHLLTEAGVDWDGLSGEVARQADALLGDEQAALILHLGQGRRRGRQPCGRRTGTASSHWPRWTILRWVSSRPCAGTNRVTLLDTWPVSRPGLGRGCRTPSPQHSGRGCANCEARQELSPGAGRSAHQHRVPFGYVEALTRGYGKDPAFLRGRGDVATCAFWPMPRGLGFWNGNPRGAPFCTYTHNSQTQKSLQEGNCADCRPAHRDRTGRIRAGSSRSLPEAAFKLHPGEKLAR